MHGIDDAHAVVTDCCKVDVQFALLYFLQAAQMNQQHCQA
jgi:hypothetical protein